MTKKKKKPIKKCVEDLKIFFQRHTDDQKAQEKTLNTNKQRSANRNYKVSPHTSQNGRHQKSTNNKRWRGCGEQETLL